MKSLFQPSHVNITMEFIKRWQRLLFIFLVCALLLSCTSTASAQVVLGTSQRFGVLGASAVTNTGLTTVTGDLGVSPGTSITGFPPGSVIGVIHMNDAVASQAQADATTAYNTLAGMACNTVLTGQDLGGLTLTPGVYCFTSSAQLTGTLTLDAQGDPNAVFVFQIASALTTASNSSVQFKPMSGGQSCNVFWQIGSSATLGTNTNFIGSIIALASITLNTGTTLMGRALALTGAVTMDTNAITATFCGPTIGANFSPVIINAGGVSTKTITLLNPNATPAALTAPLVDNLPAGLLIAATPNASTTCGGVLAAPAGGSAFSLTGGTIPGGAPGSCTVTVNVTAAVGGTYINNLPAGSLQTSNGSNSAAAIASLTVIPPNGPPVLGVAFSPTTVSAGGVSTKTITLINPNATPAILTAPLTDNLPTGLVIATPPNASTTCGGVLTAPAGGSSFTLAAGATIPGGSPGSCTVTVNVTAATTGNYFNTLPAGALQTSNGNNTSPVIATLTVVAPPPAPVVVGVGDGKTGSVLVFPYYNSKNGSDTRLTISNIGDMNVTVHLFFVDASCNQADLTICLTPNASQSFLASEYDPENTGYLIAVAVSNDAAKWGAAIGCPVQYNGLIGNAFVNDGAYTGNYGAEAFWAHNPPAMADCDLTNSVATLRFSGNCGSGVYDRQPNQLVAEIQSPNDSIGQKIVTVGLTGSLSNGVASTGAAQTGIGVASNDGEKPGSFSSPWTGTCQRSFVIDPRTPRVPGGLGSQPGINNNALIPAGRTGTLKWNVSGAVGLIMTPKLGTNKWSGIRTLHKTRVTSDGNTLTIPIFMSGANC